MNTFHIQVLRPSGWRDITTVRFDPAVDRAKEGSVPRRIAFRDARRQLIGWSQYHAFVAERLRLVERVSHDRFVEAVA